MPTKKDSPLYWRWKEMRYRCQRPKNQDYPRYGGRGIKVDPSWEIFENFARDVGMPPTPEHTLDRIDNDKDYCKENCRWATVVEQARNRWSAKGCKKGHPWTEESTGITHNGKALSRICLICRKDWETKRRTKPTTPSEGER